MAEVLIEFDNEFRARNGHAYEARACGRERDDGLWEAWVEFTPSDGEGPVLRTTRETTQPNRDDLRYWATGLTVGFLDGALDRALGVRLPDLRPRAITGGPAYDAPRPPAGA